MRRDMLTENTAKAAIFVLFTVTLLCAILFYWSARTGTASAVQPTAADQMNWQQEQLAKELALSSELQQLERELAAARMENAELSSENENLNQATVSMLDSLQLEYVGEYYATAYCCERYPHICGGNGVTASGTVPTPGLTCAADWNVLPPGTWLYIEGVGLRRVEDSGSAIKGKRLDIAVDTHQNALRWPGLGNHHTWVLNFEGETA
ncbi:hypothetical protein LJC49_08325 [Ruminococcaceae bacterium OttesenSCG-928-I18]|nr:hypothetical protein [Ruminococcaceae bacterium OttesenSCG-928-I18]